ncbi:MAG: hypothetical protein P8169_15950 [Chloroflexota bacterium]
MIANDRVHLSRRSHGNSDAAFFAELAFNQHQRIMQDEVYIGNCHLQFVQRSIFLEQGNDLRAAKGVALDQANQVLHRVVGWIVQHLQFMAQADAGRCNDAQKIGQLLGHAGGQHTNTRQTLHVLQQQFSIPLQQRLHSAGLPIYPFTTRFCNRLIHLPVQTANCILPRSGK